MRHALDQPPRVDEHERRAVRARQLGEPIVELAPTARWCRRRQLVLAAPRWRDRGRAAGPRRRSRGAGRPPPHSSRAADLDAAAPSPTGRCAASPAALTSAAQQPRAARATAPGARRACRRATAWISSTITVRTSRSASRARLARSAGCRATRAWSPGRAAGCCIASRRSLAGVSPVRTAARIARAPRSPARPPAPRARRAAPRGSADVVGQRLERRDVDDAGSRSGSVAGQIASRDQPVEAGRGTPPASCPSPWAP